jgi:hypothetical protein
MEREKNRRELSSSCLLLLLFLKNRAEDHAGLQVRLSSFTQSVEFPTIKFNENSFGSSGMVLCAQTDRLSGFSGRCAGLL